MSLSVITSRRKWRKFLVYDLEWVPETYELRVIGVYDGNQYRCYRSVEDFLNNELTSKNRGRWFYAHAGGLADMSFLIEKFAALLGEKGGYTVKCAFSGSSAIIVQVSRGKNSWTFVDSYWLLRDKLANIAKWLGTEKGNEVDDMTDEERKEFYRSAPLHVLIPYNEQDCVILWDAINELQFTLWDLGGQLQRTLASSAMNLFRRRFLAQNIETGWGINARAEQAYYASRVEVFNEHAYTGAEYYDINSSFPYAMTQPCPGDCIKINRTLPDHGIYVAHVTVEVPETFLPPLPMRIKGRLFFPVGTWRAWLSNVDVELLQMEGGRVLNVHEVMHFAPFTDLAAYATTLYDMRKAAETPFERTAFKLLLNSLYGKFAESRTKSALHLNPKKIDRERWTMLFPGAWLYEKDVPVPHRHVPISVHITALARRTLFNYMNDSQQVHYCDTDGFSTMTGYDVTNELGGLKLEKRLVKPDGEWSFVQPKGYNISDGEELQKDGTWEALGDKGVKLKGFSRMSMAKWGKLIEGEAIAHERMYRIKEQARRGLFMPGERTVMKRMQQNVLQKRFHYPDGTTRPWTFKELAAYFNGNRKW